MWMTDYVREVKRQLRDTFGCEVIGGTKDEPNVNATNGIYPVTINSKTDYVVVIDDTISILNMMKPVTK